MIFDGSESLWLTSTSICFIKSSIGPIAASGSQEDESNEHESGKEQSPHIARFLGFLGFQLRFEDVRSLPSICIEPNSD